MTALLFPGDLDCSYNVPNILLCLVKKVFSQLRVKASYDANYFSHTSGVDRPCHYKMDWRATILLSTVLPSTCEIGRIGIITTYTPALPPA
tara:strand:- start:253 stop:525 length:273 start_codon:yes stop_codon:yes gene_type:complete